MASTGKCPFCGAVVTSDQKTCPECGGENPGYVVDTPQRIMNPRTIEELKEYCAERNMPLLRMRFFIGEDYYGPRAFGIFKDGTGKVTVYKNKADGSRAVRYAGPDEKHAVQEIYHKLLEECRMRGINPDQSLNQEYSRAGYHPSQNARSASRNGSSSSGTFSKSTILKLIVFAIIFLVVASIFLRGCTYCVSSGVPGYLFSSDGGSGSSWDSGGSGSFWDWDSDNDHDSGSSSWDSGSSSWDSWDSGSSDWGSDW